MSPRPVRLSVNGQEHSVEVEDRRLLVDCLREDVGVLSPHIGCEQGRCGACTVLWDGRAVFSCLVFAVQAEGVQLTTAEGLLDDGQLGPVQEAFRDARALQCGYCSPGFVVATEALLDENPHPTEEQAREYLRGNVCRCGGYPNILRAVGIAQELRVQRRGLDRRPRMP